MPAFLTETLARTLYKRRAPQTADNPVPPITYSRAFYDRDIDYLFTNRASGMTSLGVLTNHSVLVVGSAFGFLLEELLALGVVDAYGIEPGSWCWDAANDGEWPVGVKARTANDWIGSGTEQASLTGLAGVTGQAKFNWIIDEDAAPAHSDAELPAFLAGLEARLQGNVKGRIVHVVTPLDPASGPGDSSQNWKTLADWETWAPDHTWVSARAG